MITGPLMILFFMTAPLFIVTLPVYLAPAVHRSIDLSFYVLIKDHGICLEKIILLPCIKPPAGQNLASHLMSHID